MIKRLMALLIILLVSCGGVARDAKLESEISALIDAEEVLVISNFGQIVVNIACKNVLELPAEKREDLANKLALKIVALRTNVSAVMISFSQAEPNSQLVAYAWSNNNGKLTKVQQQ